MEIFKNSLQQEIMNLRSKKKIDKSEAFLTEVIKEATKRATGWKENSKSVKLIPKEINRLMAIR